MRDTQHSQIDHNEELCSLQKVINSLIQDKDRLNDILLTDKHAIEEKNGRLE
jgi:hypothetical protein